MSKHTPGPWVIGALESGQAAIDGVGGDVTGWISIDDANHIVRCVNAHADMLEALESAIGNASITDIDDEVVWVISDRVMETIRAAIKKARGQS